MTLTYSDLYAECPKCQGAKKLPVSINTGYTSYQGQEDCPDCKGHGGEYTAAGLAVEKFLRQLKSDGRL
jgi:DnaJ-class molecular chaperone